MNLRDALVDTLGLGLALWLAGYLASLALYFILPKSLLGWVLFAFFTPVTVAVVWWRFSGRGLPLAYFFGVAAAWTAIAVAFDYVFIVLLLNAQGYYAADVFLYYAATFAIPALAGFFLARRK
jgi:hypothetical protein